MSALLWELVSHVLIYSVITFLFLLALPWLQKRYRAGWLYAVLVVLGFLWLIPWRPSITLPWTLQEVQAAVITLPVTVAPAAPAAAGAAEASASFSPLPLLWLAGAAVLALVFLVRQLRFQAFVRRWSKPADITVPVSVLSRAGLKKAPRALTCPGLPPMLCGLLRPAVLLPERDIPGEHRAQILLHECIHQKHRDLWWKLLGLAVVCLNWWNPIAWWWLHALNAQCELYCDQAVLRCASETERRAYGAAILYTLQVQLSYKPVLSTSFQGGKILMKTRVNAIIHPPRRRALLPVFLLVVILLLSACSFNQKSETLTGYITIQDGKVILDEVEIITEDDTDRIEELGLTYQGDLISGYYIYDEEGSTRTFDLTDKTEYRFVDFGRLYTTAEDLNYETTSLEEFLTGSSYAANAAPNASDIPSGRIPYSVEVRGGTVISITEEFRYTI